MKDEIRIPLNDPGQLEKMYQSNKLGFKREFNMLYPEIKDSSLADFWYERLNYENEELNWGTRKELLFVVIAAILAGAFAKLPAFLPLAEDFFYPRNIGFIIFPILMFYFAWKNKLSSGKITFIVGASLTALVFINFLPYVQKSDTLMLSCIHIILFLWSILGFAFTGGLKTKEEKRLSFLKYNGDLLVIIALLFIACMMLSGITIGLFSLIGYDIAKLYFKNIGIFGLAALPIIGTYLTQTNPQLVGKISPVIAKLFSPLVVLMLIIYLIAIIYTAKNPYNDRDSLLIFNALLIGVMAIIFFSVAESTRTVKSKAEMWILLVLSTVTIVLNCVTLSAIVFRITEWGITPNRTAVLGGNILILINLILVTIKLFKVITKKADTQIVGNVIATYLPVYFIWTIIVSFIFPLIFGFK